MENDAEGRITIRKLTHSDIDGVWEVLSDAAYSHIWPGLLLTVKKKTFHVCSVSLALLIYICTRSLVSFTCIILASFVAAYTFHWIVAIYYLYGPPLTDMKFVFQNYLSSEDCCFWVAQNAGDNGMKIVGTIAIINRSGRQNVNTEAWLRRMAVHRTFRGKGIAGQLLQTAVDFCIQHKYKRIRLITTEVHLPARNLYRKYGFTCISYKPVYYLKGLVPIWTFEYEKRL